PARHCIWLMLTGAPGHVDTWDPKPAASSEYRGPFRPIATCVPGLDICEHFPRLAGLADRLALVRGMSHPGPALHETGWRYALTGDDFEPPQGRPYAGSLLSRHALVIADGPTSVILPGRYLELGINRWTGEFAAELGTRHEAWEPGKRLPHAGPVSSARLAKDLNLADEPAALRDRYGRHELGENCLRARRLVESGLRWTQINHFRSVSGGLSWDMHAGAQRLCTTFDDYAQVLCPQLDQALSALLIDLESRGLLAETVVAVVAEMGRSPQLNARGGREHHTAAWTNLLAGGPIGGGRVIGATDRLGAEIIDRPTSPGEFLASTLHALGLSPAETGLGRARPIAELFS
ncbi:MAG TPA: DUF1501 domain-containing protein, partial [Pirellulales bacterium]